MILLISLAIGYLVGLLIAIPINKYLENKRWDRFDKKHNF